MRIKRIVSTMLLAIMLPTIIIMFTGCSKDTQVTQVELTSIEFNEEEAFRLGDYQIGIDTFMLYAIDALPGFISEFGEDCWTQESIDLSWRKEAPQKAFILYLTDIIVSAVSCDIYHQSAIGELEDSVKEISAETARERYEALLEAGMPEGIVSEESIYQYTSSIYRLSYIMDELSTTYNQDQGLIQSAILGMRNSIDATFDYDRNINWELVESIDFSVATNIDSE